VEVTIARGTPIADIAGGLEGRGLIRRAGAFVLLARVTGRDRRLQAGNYLLPRGRSAAEILRIIVRGDVARSLVTIPEGLRVVEVAEIVGRGLGVDPSSFVELCGRASFAESLGVPGRTLEGYLFPETYSVLRGSTASALAERMVRLGAREYAAAAAGKAPPNGLDRAGVVTLASIIQAEARRDDEMPRISAVFHNRLRRGWRLEADPTVQYALGARKPRLLYEDLDVDSPFNTYRHEGLPPGPICSPGRAAIRAAVEPAPGEASLYFVARGDGTHVFTKTLEEHLRARAALRGGR
jgi:UPF0755 protein